MDTDRRQGEEALDRLTETVIGAAFNVHNALGAGFLEKVYENALTHELRKRGLDVGQQVSCPVCYDGVVVGDYVADLVVEGRVLVELKAIRSLDDMHLAQCLNYLAATRLPLCLLLNFGRRVTVRRVRI
jgi:GxxExxY protein